MRISPPDVEISLYEDGFQNYDLLSRRKQGKDLSDLVEKIDEPLVIAIDGPWGSGKTFFLKCWVGAHSIENGGSATTVYFDAFENDFLDDPLIGLTAALASRVEARGKGGKAIRMAKVAAAKVWRPAVRIGLALGTAGASEIAGAVVDAGLDSASKEIGTQVDDFWKKEDGKRAAMAEFRAALVKLTEPNDGGLPTKKFVFVVDELDRCRPDFSLNTLEVVKHFFFVPGVHFVLGVNSSELLNTVRARYGENVDAIGYLQKFISVSITLSEVVEPRSQNARATDQYFEIMVRRMGLNGNLVDEVNWWIENFRAFQLTSIRHAQRVLTEIALIPSRDGELDRLYFGWLSALAALILIKHSNADLMRKARSGSLLFEDVAEALSIPSSIDSETEQPFQIANHLWRSILAPDTLESDDGFKNMWGGRALHPRGSVVQRLLSDYLDAVSLTGETFQT